jgi:hypothetical protein
VARPKRISTAKGKEQGEESEYIILNNSNYFCILDVDNYEK